MSKEPITSTDTATLRQQLASAMSKFGQTRIRGREHYSTAMDYQGREYYVAIRKPTMHGFDILIGYLVDARQSGRRATIITSELAEYLKRTHRRGETQLPLTYSNIKDLRRALGIKALTANAQWWLDRLDDLRNLTDSEFVARHGSRCSEKVVNYKRLQLIGPTQLRPRDWWRNPETIALLKSDRSGKEIGQKLGVAPKSVSYYRVLIAQEEGATPQEIKKLRRQRLSRSHSEKNNERRNSRTSQNTSSDGNAGKPDAGAVEPKR